MGVIGQLYTDSLKVMDNEVANIELYANARYVRMYGYTRVESGSGFSIKEMKVYKYKSGRQKGKP